MLQLVFMLVQTLCFSLQLNLYAQEKIAGSKIKHAARFILKETYIIIKMALDLCM